MTTKKGLNFFHYFTISWHFAFGISCIVRGCYWIVLADKAQNESKLYMDMHDIMPLNFWGVPFVIAGILIILAGIKVPYHETSMNFYRITTWGYALACPFYYIFSTAGFVSGLNIVTPVMNLSFSIFCGITSILAYKRLREMKSEKGHF